MNTEIKSFRQGKGQNLMCDYYSFSDLLAARRVIGGMPEYYSLDPYNRLKLDWTNDLKDELDWLIACKKERSRQKQIRAIKEGLENLGIKVGDLIYFTNAKSIKYRLISLHFAEYTSELNATVERLPTKKKTKIRDTRPVARINRIENVEVDIRKFNIIKSKGIVKPV